MPSFPKKEYIEIAKEIEEEHRKGNYRVMEREIDVLKDIRALLQELVNR